MAKTCIIENCKNKHQAKGLCEKHYRKRRYWLNREKELENVKKWQEENKEHVKEVKKKYVKNNKEKVRASQKKYRLENKEKMRKLYKRYQIENKEKILARRKEYNKKNKEKISAYIAKNRERIKEYRKIYNQLPERKIMGKVHSQRRRSLMYDLTKDTIQLVYEDNIKKYGTLTCILCFKPIEFGQDSLEHKTPLSRGGNNDYDNLGVAHRVCNSKKHNKTLEEWENNYETIRHNTSRTCRNVGQ